MARIPCIYLFAHNSVCLAQNLKFIIGNVADNTHRKTRTREWLTVHDVVRQPQLTANRAHFIFKQCFERLNQIEMNTFREWNQIMVALNLGRRLAARLNNIGIQRSLRKPFDAARTNRCTDFVSLLKKDLPKLFANNATLLLRLGNVILVHLKSFILRIF